MCDPCPENVTEILLATVFLALLQKLELTLSLRGESPAYPWVSLCFLGG
jgi:hypothetical protein